MVMFSGITIVEDVCHAAPSLTSTKIIAGALLREFLKKYVQHEVLQQGITKILMSELFHHQPFGFWGCLDLSMIFRHWCRAG